MAHKETLHPFSIKGHIDQHYLAGARFTRRLTWPEQRTPNDFVVRLGGFDIGRIHMVMKTRGEHWWNWSFDHEVWRPDAPWPQQGSERTYERAALMFKAAFAEWLDWAMRQNDWIPWSIHTQFKRVERQRRVPEAPPRKG